MVKFGDLSQEEKQAFIEAVKKNAEQSTEVRIVCPDDATPEEIEEYLEFGGLNRR